MMDFLYTWSVPAVVVFLAYRVVVKDGRTASPFGKNSETAVWLVGAVLLVLYYHSSASFKGAQLEANLSFAESECFSIASKEPAVEDALIEYVCKEITDARDLNGKRPSP